MSAILRSFSHLLNPGPYQVPTGSLKVDWQHPLSRSLIGCWVPGVTGGIDLTNSMSMMQRVAGSQIKGMTQEGPCYGPSPAEESSMRCLASLPCLVWPGATIYWRGLLKQKATEQTWLAVNVANVNNTPSDVLTLRSFLANTLIMVGNSGGTQIYSPGTQANISSYWDTIVSFCGTTRIGGTMKLYVNGALASGTNASQASAPAYSATANVQINGWAASAPRYGVSACTCAYIFNREFSAQEVGELHLNPYCFLLPAEIEMPIMIPSISNWQLYFSKNSGAYEPVTTTSLGVKSADASTDADETKILIPRL